MNIKNMPNYSVPLSGWTHVSFLMKCDVQDALRAPTGFHDLSALRDSLANQIGRCVQL